MREDEPGRPGPDDADLGQGPSAPVVLCQDLAQDREGAVRGGTAQ